jgi:ATP/ADP translocase
LWYSPYFLSNPRWSPRGARLDSHLAREAKYKAKAAIDTFFMRTGDALSALLVFVGTYRAFNVEKFAFINILVVILWLFLTLGIARQHRQLPSPARARVSA